MFSTAGFPVAVRALRELNLEGAVLGSVTGAAVRRKPEFTSAVLDAICVLLPRDDVDTTTAHCSKPKKINAPVDLAVALATYLLPANPHFDTALEFSSDEPLASTGRNDAALPGASTSFSAVLDASLQLKQHSYWIRNVLQPGTATASSLQKRQRIETQTLFAAQGFAQAMHACFMETEKVRELAARGFTGSVAKRFYLTLDLIVVSSSFGSSDADVCLLLGLVRASVAKELDTAVCRRLKLPRKLVRRAARVQCAALAAVSLELLPVAFDSSRVGDGNTSFEDFVLFGLWLQWAKEEDWEDALQVAFAIDAARMRMGPSSCSDLESLRHAYGAAARATSESALRQVAQAAPCVNGGEIIGAGVSSGPHVGLLLAAAKVIEIGAVFAADGASVSVDQTENSEQSSSATRSKVLAWIESLASSGDLE